MKEGVLMENASSWCHKTNYKEFYLLEKNPSFHSSWSVWISGVPRSSPREIVLWCFRHGVATMPNTCTSDRYECRALNELRLRKMNWLWSQVCASRVTAVSRTIHTFQTVLSSYKFSPNYFSGLLHINNEEANRNTFPPIQYVVPK